MGIKNLWAILEPHALRKPVYELRGKKVAIDLAGWICESSNVVDYSTHSHYYLRILYCRTSFLILEEVSPIFVLEGEAPTLKSKIILKRREVQFKGVKPNKSVQSCVKANRNGFSYVLKQCEAFLKSMGIQCLKAPGEAEAYCSLLNKKGIVDGVISQDSDCFAYGAVCVYRNFSITSQFSSNNQTGFVDVYDISKIYETTGIGQNKAIAVAILCGCDYSEGIKGIGRDSVLKLFEISTEDNILQKINAWKKDESKYKDFEMKINDKNICSNCGHFGNSQNHAKSGCKLCGTIFDCDHTLWKGERNQLKLELKLRKRVLQENNFLYDEIINEFLLEIDKKSTNIIPWYQPNYKNFKKFGLLLQWSDIECFKKFLRIFTRWQLLCSTPDTDLVIPNQIRKKQVLKKLICLEILWRPDEKFFVEFDENFLKTTDEKIWTTIEPLDVFQRRFPALVENFFASIEKPLFSKKKKKKNCKKSLCKKYNNRWNKKTLLSDNVQCSTPCNSITAFNSELESDSENKSINLSYLIRGIVQNPHTLLLKYSGKSLNYDSSEELEIRESKI